MKHSADGMLRLTFGGNGRIDSVLTDNEWRDSEL